VPIAVTFNDHFRFNEDYDDDVRVALAVRMAFHFFVDHCAYGFVGESGDFKRRDAASRFQEHFGDVLAAVESISPNIAMRVLKSVNAATGSDKIMALIVDETAQIPDADRLTALTRCLKDTADSLECRKVDETKVGRVACVVTGTTLAAWRRAGFKGWFEYSTTSPRALIWLGLPGALTALTRDAIFAEIERLLSYLKLEKSRRENLAQILWVLGSGHWRTYETMLRTIKDREFKDALSTAPNATLESKFIEEASRTAATYWKGPSLYNDTEVEAFALLLSLSNLYQPCFPKADLPIAGTGSGNVGDWLEHVKNLQPIKQETFDAENSGDEAPVVPRFSLYAVRAFAEKNIYSESFESRSPPILRKFSRHLYALLTTRDLHNIHAGPFWERWEYDLAHMLRLKFISLYLKRAQSWRKATGQFATWPASGDLQTFDETVPLSSESIDETEAGLALLQGFKTVGQLAEAKILLSSNFSGTPHCEALDAELWTTERAITDTYKRGKLINSAIEDRGNFRTIFPAKILNGERVAINWSDAIAAVLSRSLRPGDVLVLGDSSIGVDVVALVRLASDGNRPERNGLVFFQAKWQYGESSNNRRKQKNREGLRTTVEGCSTLRDVLFGEKRAEWMGDFDVAEEDVLIVLATHSPGELEVVDMENILQEKNSRFSVAFAGLDYSDDASGITTFFGKTLGLRASMRPGFMNEVKENEARASAGKNFQRPKKSSVLNVLLAALEKFRF